MDAKSNYVYDPGCARVYRTTYTMQEEYLKTLEFDQPQLANELFGPQNQNLTVIAAGLPLTNPYPEKWNMQKILHTACYEQKYCEQNAVVTWDTFLMTDQHQPASDIV